MDLVKSAGLMLVYQAAFIMVKLRKTFLAANAEKAIPPVGLYLQFLFGDPNWHQLYHTIPK